MARGECYHPSPPSDTPSPRPLLTRRSALQLSDEEKAEWAEKAAELKAEGGSTADEKADKPAARKGAAAAGKGKGGKEKAAPSTRTKSAYVLWSADERKKLLEEQPDIKASFPPPTPCCFPPLPPSSPAPDAGPLLPRT